MPRNKLQAALKNNGGAIANVTPRYEKLTDEQMRLAAFEARDNQEGASPTRWQTAIVEIRCWLKWV